VTFETDRIQRKSSPFERVPEPHSVQSNPMDTGAGNNADGVDMPTFQIPEAVSLPIGGYDMCISFQPNAINLDASTSRADGGDVPMVQISEAIPLEAGGRDMWVEEGSVLPIGSIHIRVYKNAKDWWHIGELTAPHAPDGSLDIVGLESELVTPGKICVHKPESVSDRRQAYLPLRSSIHKITGLCSNIPQVSSRHMISMTCSTRVTCAL
jgi:hypothetical protein